MIAVGDGDGRSRSLNELMLRNLLQEEGLEGLIWSSDHNNGRLKEIDHDSAFGF